MDQPNWFLIILFMRAQVSDPKSLHAAVEDILERLHGAVKPVLIAGKTRAPVP